MAERPVYNFDDLVEGKPRVCQIRREGEEVEYDRLTETTNKSDQEGGGVGDEEKVVLNMMADLAQDTVVILGKEKVKAQLEDELRAKNLEWECFKKKNEDWKEMLAYQRANPTCITLDGDEEEEKKTSSRKSAKKRSSKSSNSKDSSEAKKKGGSKEKSEVKTKKTPELPRSPRKEGSVLHPFFRKVPT